MIKQDLTKKELADFFEQKAKDFKSGVYSGYNKEHWLSLASFCEYLKDEFADKDLSYCTKRKDFVYTGEELPKIKVKR
jgi:hypothetical protein